MTASWAEHQAAAIAARPARVEVARRLRQREADWLADHDCRHAEHLIDMQIGMLQDYAERLGEADAERDHLRELLAIKDATIAVADERVATLEGTIAILSARAAVLNAQLALTAAPPAPARAPRWQAWLGALACGWDACRGLLGREGVRAYGFAILVYVAILWGVRAMGGEH